MRLYEEILQEAEDVLASKCIVVPNGGGYFEGVKAVGDFAPERIVVCFKKTQVEVLGKGLSIKKYCEGDLQISGKISALQVLDGEG